MLLRLSQVMCRGDNMNRDFLEEWLEKLREFWIQKNPEKCASLFLKTTYYQETPFDEAYTTYEGILEEWQGIKNQDIKELRFSILAIDGNVAIVEWNFVSDAEYNGIYEIIFNDNQECISFRSWEMVR